MNELIQEYEKHLFNPEEHITAKIARGQCSIVIAFERFLAARHLELIAATPKHVHDYLLNRSSMGISYYGLGFHLTMLRGFYSFLIQKGLIEKTPARTDCMPDFHRYGDGKDVISIKDPHPKKSGFGLTFDLEEILEEADKLPTERRLKLVPPPESDETA